MPKKREAKHRVDEYMEELTTSLPEHPARKNWPMPDPKDPHRSNKWVNRAVAASAWFWILFIIGGAIALWVAS